MPTESSPIEAEHKVDEQTPVKTDTATDSITNKAAHAAHPLAHPATGQRPYTLDDAEHSPMLVFYEATRACDLACSHCRACAQPIAHRNELTPEQSLALIDQLAAFPRPPMLVLTGGDPLKRPDLFDLIGRAVHHGLITSVVPATTPRLTAEVIRRLKDAGVARLGVSIDGPDAQTHDRFRGVCGTFDAALRALRDAQHVGLPTQVNTTVGPHNLDAIPDMADLIEPLGVTLWSLFFIVPVGRAVHEPRLSPEQYEAAFEALWLESRRRCFGVKTTEAPFYRRFVLQHQGDPQQRGGMHELNTSQPAPMNERPTAGRPHRAPLGINDGKGILFVSHTGSVYPSGFLPITCGRFPEDSVIDAYQHHEVFGQLRQPDGFGGKCGRCDYRHACGGSRARAYALTRDYLAAEPDCAYQPQAALMPGIVGP